MTKRKPGGGRKAARIESTRQIIQIINQALDAHKTLTAVADKVGTRVGVIWGVYHEQRSCPALIVVALCKLMGMTDKQAIHIYDDQRQEYRIILQERAAAAEKDLAIKQLPPAAKAERQAADKARKASKP